MYTKVGKIGKKLVLQMLTVVLLVVLCPMVVSATKEEELPCLIAEPLVSNLSLYAEEGSNNYFDKGITGSVRCMPSIGDVKTLVFAVEFADKKFTEENLKADLERYFFSEQNKEDDLYPNESLRAFYQRSSFGKLNISGEVVTFSLEKERSYYDGNITLLVEDLSKEFEDDKLEEFNGDETALNKYMEQFDLNDDGILDGLYIYFAGGNDSWGTDWWSYVGQYSSAEIGECSVGNVCLTGTIAPLTLIHETGHMLGLEDYYDYEAAENEEWQESMYGIAGIDMMQGNAGDHNAFSKMLLGWIEPEHITIITEGIQEIELEEYREAGDCVIIVPDYDEEVGLYTEFFLVNFREYQGYNTDLFFDDYNKDIEGGICIYYVNATLTEDKQSFLYDSGYAGKYGEIPLIRQIHADGENMHSSNEIYGYGILFSWPWERAGHEDTCFYHTGDEFSPYSLPSSAVYGDISTNEKRAYSGVVVTDISIGEDTAKITLGIEEQSQPKPITYEVESASGTYSAIDKFKAELHFSSDVTLEGGVNKGKTFVKENGAKLLGQNGTELGNFTIYLSKVQNGYTYLGISSALQKKLEEDTIYQILIPAGTFYDSTGGSVPEIIIEYSTVATYEVNHIWENDPDMREGVCIDKDGNGVYLEKTAWWIEGEELNIQLVKDYVLSETIPTDKIESAIKELCGNDYYHADLIYKVADGQWGWATKTDNKIYFIIFDNAGNVIKKESITTTKTMQNGRCLNPTQVAVYGESDVYLFEGDSYKKFSFDTQSKDDEISIAWNVYWANGLYLFDYSTEAGYEQLIFDTNGQVKAYLEEAQIHDFEYRDGKYYVSNFYFELDQNYSFITVYDEYFRKIEEYDCDGSSVYCIDNVNDGFVFRNDTSTCISDVYFNVVEELKAFPAYYVYGMNNNILFGVSSEGGNYIDITGINMNVEDENTVGVVLEGIDGIVVKDHTITVQEMSKADFEVLLKGYTYELEEDSQVITNDSVLKVTSQNSKCAYYYYFNIENKLEKIMLSETKLSLEEGEYQSLTIKYEPVSTTDDKTIIWSSSDEEIATVSSTGKVTGIKSGTAIITAKVGELTATCQVTVKPVSKLTLSESSVSLITGESSTVTVYVDGTASSGSDYTWTSSNTKVATVNSAGKITGVGAGNATVTCTAADGRTLTVEVIVNNNESVKDDENVQVNGLTNVDGKYIWLTDGVKDTSKTGLLPYDGQWFYIVKGELSKTNGFVEYDGETFYVAEGRMLKETSGLVGYDDEFYYIAEGRVVSEYTGLAEYDRAWFYVTNGKMDPAKSGMVEYDDGLFYVGAGKIMTEKSGLAQDPVTGKWYFLANGQVQKQHTGLALYDGAWFYVIKGEFAKDYIGYVTHDGSEFYVVKGEVKQ